jgi:hypothetical protein
MGKSMRWALVALSAAVMVPAAYAGVSSIPATVTQQKKKDNKAFIGLQWNFGVREGLSGVVGYRWATVGLGNKVKGSSLDFTYALTGQTGPGELHLKAFDGKLDVQPELGLGYGFHAGAFLLNVGVQAPNVFLGTEYLFGKGLQPYIGINTIGKYKNAPDELSCPIGYTLSGTVCNATPAN